MLLSKIFMTTENQLPERNKYFLYFKDKELEREFVQVYDESIRVPLRYGMVISILAWLVALAIVYTSIPERFEPLSLLTILIICPFFGFIFFATYGNRFKGWLHIIGAMSNAWAGCYAIYFCGQFPNGVNLTLPVLIFILFFGSYLVRLRMVAGTIAALSYTIGFHVYLVQYTDMALNQIVPLAFVAWMTLVFAVLAGYVTEHNSRVRFFQRKTIKSQKEIIEKEKEESERLLLNILPPYIAKRLKQSNAVIADNHQDASVLFADIVGFTNLSSQLPAHKIIEILNKVFSNFDQLTEQHELEKIKTIGDGYMVAGGLTSHEEDHLECMAKLALDMLRFIETDDEIRDLQLKIRIGINAGPVVAGVLGIKKFSYDLWGDTVNVGSRMESQGKIGEINVSETVQSRLQHLFEFEERGVIDLKGKGEIRAFLLKGVKEPAALD